MYTITILFVVVLLTGKKTLSLADKANVADWQHIWANRIDGLIRLFCYRYHRLPKQYIPLPEAGPAIVVANHISGLDPLLLIAASKRPLRFLIAKEEYERYGLQWLFKLAGCIPVDRSSKPEKALRQALAAIDRGEVVAIFPQGGIQWPVNKDAPFKIKGGAVRLAKRKNIPLIPVVVDGVGLKGSTMLAVIKRSQAVLNFEQAMCCQGMPHEQCMAVLAQKLNRV
ncbi:MAG TPA: 1-acyl-sn-glycerol-3-phosphate acyltransferase [Gammaproteobacteria bacterium]|nr:1-acyl-sn-glycerol-3-phosphate acyltransferase [Gammaproteobacteria bacterium]